MATPVASSDPALLTVMVNVITSPTLDVAVDTVFVSDRSACLGVTVSVS